VMRVYRLHGMLQLTPSDWNLTDGLCSDWISDEMHVLEPEAFAGREPTAKKVHRVALVALGPHHQWSGDGHDKLVKIGFPIWGIRDMWTGKWLGLWTVPDNRLKVTIAYLYLSLVAELGGRLLLLSFLVCIFNTACCRYAYSVYHGLWQRDCGGVRICNGAAVKLVTSPY
jgi:hypothetical protein